MEEMLDFIKSSKQGVSNREIEKKFSDLSQQEVVDYLNMIRLDLNCHVKGTIIETKQDATK